MTPKTPGDRYADLVTGDFVARFEPRTLDDIRAFGRNSEADDLAFATVGRLSELNLNLYRTYVQPFVQVLVGDTLAQMIRHMNPLRLSYTIFADENPAMAPVAALADRARAERTPVPEDNPFWSVQEAASDFIESSLNVWRSMRDLAGEAWFFNVFGAPGVQAMLGTADGGAIRQLPPISPAEIATQKSARKETRAKMSDGGLNEAVIRALLFALQGEGKFDERVAAAFRHLYLQHSHLTHEQLKRIVRDQAAVLQLDPLQAIQCLAMLLPDDDATRTKLLELVTEIIATTGTADAQTDARLDQIAAALSLKRETQLPELRCV